MEAVLIFKSYKGPVIVRNNNDYYCSGYDCKLGVYKYNKVQLVDLSFDDEGRPEPTYNYLNQ